jgi:hypothetical protein
MYVIADEVKEAGAQISSAAPVSATENHLNDLIERASRYFDLVAGVTPGFFEASTGAATVRTFYGDGTNYLKLDKYVEGSLNATIVVPDGYTAPTFIERDGYLVLVTEDVGAVISSLPPFAHWWRDGRGWWAGLPITVTAKWGYAQTPADVKMAIIEMVINLLRETDPASLNLLDLERQPLREWMPPRVRAVAERYRMQGAVLV